MDVVVSTEGHWPDDVERILRLLPEWFGLEDPILGYIRDASVLPNVVAHRGDEVVGVCLIRRHNPVAAEIDLMAVPPEHHRQGIGRALIERAKADLAADGVVLLQVKTFGPSGDSEEYERTRAFYAALGFVPLEERTDIWGPEDPCLISVMPLAIVEAG